MSQETMSQETMSQETMEAVRELVQLVSGDATAEEVSRALGSGAEGAHGPGVIAVTPRRAAFARALVTPDSVEGVDYVIVQAELRPEAGLRVGDLRGAFGGYEHLRRAAPGAPWRLGFTADAPGQPYVCALEAEAEGPAEGPEEGWRVVALTARRTPRDD